MEIKLTVNIGASLQVRNAKGDWDWVKPEIGAEVKLIEGEVTREYVQETFAKMWDLHVGPQFRNVVNELIGEQLQPAIEEETETTDDTKKDEDDYDTYD